MQNLADELAIMVCAGSRKNLSSGDNENSDSAKLEK
jgi:hypothetical protein